VPLRPSACALVVFSCILPLVPAASAQVFRTEASHLAFKAGLSGTTYAGTRALGLKGIDRHLGTEVGDDYQGASFGEAPRDPEPDSPSGARQQHHLAVDPHRVPLDPIRDHAAAGPRPSTDRTLLAITVAPTPGWWNWQTRGA
jgi:hypothetical protein